MCGYHQYKLFTTIIHQYACLYIAKLLFIVYVVYGIGPKGMTQKTLSVQRCFPIPKGIPG